MVRSAGVAVMVLSLLASGPARADEEKVAEQGGKVYLLDMAGKSKLREGVFKVSARTLFPGNPKVKEKKADEIYDCTAGTIHTDFVTVTLPNGKTVTQMLDETDRPGAGSVGEMKLRRVCPPPAVPAPSPTGQ